MKGKWAIFVVLTAFLVLAMNSGSKAVDASEIDEVREKGVLNSEDLQVIDKFVAEAVRELVETRDFTSISKTRMVILARNSSNKESAQAQYAEQFSESAYKYIFGVFKTAGELTPQERRLKVILNFLILMDSLEDVRLTDLAMGLLKDENAVIRYWAVHSVTNAGVIEQLNSGETANLELASEIAEELKDLVEGASPEIIALIAQFAAEVDIPQGEDLLLQIADMRISEYAGWTVDYELLDATILKLLYSKMPSAELSRAAIARRFGQLYSYAMQRYIRDIKGENFLNSMEKQQLASVLVETEKCCIGKLLGMPQTTIKKAIERDDYVTLLQEHSRLLGDETRAGKLASKLNFNYGQSDDGAKRTAPLVLPEPPNN